MRPTTSLFLEEKVVDDERRELYRLSGIRYIDRSLERVNGDELVGCIFLVAFMSFGCLNSGTRILVQAPFFREPLGQLAVFGHEIFQIPPMFAGITFSASSFSFLPSSCVGIRFQLSVSLLEFVEEPRLDVRVSFLRQIWCSVCFFLLDSLFETFTSRFGIESVIGA